MRTFIPPIFLHDVRTTPDVGTISADGSVDGAESKIEELTAISRPPLQEAQRHRCAQSADRLRDMAAPWV